jgi:hypothetical protein
MSRDILIMGANPNALRVRINCMENLCQINDNVFLLGNDYWPSSIIIEHPRISGKSTIETLSNFRLMEKSSCPILVVSGWYHLLRCWLILRTLGFRHIKLIPSTWKLWETPLKTIINEMRSLRGVI